MMNFSIELVGLGRLQVGLLVFGFSLGVSSVGFCIELGLGWSSGFLSIGFKFLCASLIILLTSQSLLFLTLSVLDPVND